MASDYWALTIAIDPSLTPPQAGSIDDIAPLFADDRPYCVASSSRTPDLIRLLGGFADYVQGDALAYLRQFGAVLDTVQAGKAATALAAALRGIAKEPTDFFVAMEERHWHEDDILQALQQPVLASPPAEDHGASLPYVLRYLNAHLQVLQAAEAAGLSVVHGLTTH
ncbi:hypothetical protein [Chitinimonas naiadis]